MNRRRGTAFVVAFAVVIVLCSSAFPAVATDRTKCFFGDATGSADVFRLDLPEGSSFMNLVLAATRRTDVVGKESWHVGAGVLVIDATTREVVAYRLINQGTNPRGVVVESGGNRVADAPVPGPDTPFIHKANLLSASALGPGSYLVAAFGSDGSPDTPNDIWSGEIEVSGSHECQRVGAGDLIDVNHTDFTGGTQLSSPAGAVVDGATLTENVPHALVVGFVDAGVQGAGNARVTFEHPEGITSVDRAIVPFAVAGGPLRWTASLTGPGAIASIVALGIDT